jgi:hypothetical protein
VTSEKCAEAGRRACETLVERLKPIYEGLTKAHDEEFKKSGKRREITWEDLCKAAVGASVNLTAEVCLFFFWFVPSAHDVLCPSFFFHTPNRVVIEVSQVNPP